MIDRAARVLAADPAGALAICQAHAQRYPRGQFSEERERIAIEALVRLGRRGEATTRLDTFRKAFPRSGYRARLERLVGVEP